MSYKEGLCSVRLSFSVVLLVVQYRSGIESINRELNISLIYECRCDERLKDKAEGCTRLTYTKKMFKKNVYYESLKRELKTKAINECRCDERLKTRVEESTLLTCPRLVAELEHLKIETRLKDEMLSNEFTL